MKSSRLEAQRLGRQGFTLIELLVVIVVIGLLAAALLPAVQRAREAARVAACGNNLRQIGLALANFEARNGYYPSSWKVTAPDADGNVDGWSAQAVLLPYLEQGQIHSTINFNRSYEEALDVQAASGKTIKLSSLRIPTYLCPSERRDEVVIEDGVPAQYPLNYGVNLGVWMVYNPETRQGGSGMFFPGSRVKSADDADGLCYTLAAAEVKAWQPYFRNAAKTGNLSIPEPANVAGLGGQFRPGTGHTEWVDGRAHQTGFTTAFAPNTKVPYSSGGTDYDVDWTNQQEGKSTTVPTYAAITARSYHGGGVNTVMMDGSVHWVTNEIDLGVWRAYSTREGNELIPSESQLR